VRIRKKTEFFMSDESCLDELAKKTIVRCAGS